MSLNQAPLESIEARYKDLLQHLGVNSHDGAVAEINSLRFNSQLSEPQPVISESNDTNESATKYYRASDSDLINKALGVARCLSYNDSGAETKHILRELAHRLCAKCITVRTYEGHLRIVTLFGRSREMTFKERFLYRVFGVLPTMD